MAAEASLILVTEIEPTETAFFEINSSVRYHLSVINADTKALTDADTLTLTITPPYAASTTPTPTHVQLGVYYYDVILTAPGKWRLGPYQAVLGGVNVGSSTKSIIVVQPAWW